MAVIAGALLIMSVLLVTVTMRMSDHIDDLGEYYPEGMVRTFTLEEPSSFGTLGSQFSPS